MTIYIPEIDFTKVNKRALFIGTRPFFLGSSWRNDDKQKKKWNVSDTYVDDISKAEVLFIPQPVNSYTKKQLKAISELCYTYGIDGYGYISGDYGSLFPNFNNLTYFRVGGFTQQLPENNIGLPVALSDIYKTLYKDRAFETREKQDFPNVGFCGHASLSFKKRLKDNMVFAKKNVLRFFKQPFRKDYEPLFASAYQRFKLLKTLEHASNINTKFIYRQKYRAGAKIKQSRIQTNKEYYENIRHSDYVLCVRGSGNFSVRLYETLMMGRIPVFVDTNCLLPYVNDIDWKKHMVIVPWKDRHNIVEILSSFHHRLNEDDFINLQKSNRILWENKLSVAGIFNYIRQKTLDE